MNCACISWRWCKRRISMFVSVLQIKMDVVPRSAACIACIQFWYRPAHGLNEEHDTLLMIFNWVQYALQHVHSLQTLHQGTSDYFCGNVYLHWKRIAWNSNPHNLIYCYLCWGTFSNSWDYLNKDEHEPNTISSLHSCMIFCAVLQITVKYNMDLRRSMTTSDSAARQ